ncbi:MAG: hypothetical protein HN341_17340 [Verrucomicrobia bacterium]|jgi:hypothetical protein|nr:hypothetical protein [Verrucomicrobiota bacterium]
MIEYLFWGLVAGAIGSLIVLAVWDWVVEAITDWLHRWGLQKTVIMDAWVWFERMGTQAKAQLFVKRHSHQAPERISVERLEISQIDDADVREALRYRREHRQNVMHLVHQI